MEMMIKKISIVDSFPIRIRWPPVMPGMADTSYFICHVNHGNRISICTIGAPESNGEGVKAIKNPDTCTESVGTK